MGEPLRHHFLPVFYLKRWAGADGRLVEFSKPYRGVVKPRRVHPKGTGYVDRLYAVEGLPDDVAQEMERDFLSPVDSRAADALADMLKGHKLSVPQRAAWTIFVATLLLRMPQDMVKFRSIAEEINAGLMPAFEALYEAIGPGLGAPPVEVFREMAARKAALTTIANLRKFMSHEKLLVGLGEMTWQILKTDSAKHELLCSDRPVVHTDGLGHEQAHLVLPVGPRHIFLATQTPTFGDQLASVGVSRLVEATNAQIVGAAHRLVYGRSDSQLRYVQNRMGTTRATSVIERLVQMARENGWGVEAGAVSTAQAHLADALGDEWPFSLVEADD